MQWQFWRNLRSIKAIQIILHIWKKNRNSRGMWSMSSAGMKTVSSADLQRQERQSERERTTRQICGWIRRAGAWSAGLRQKSRQKKQWKMFMRSWTQSLVRSLWIRHIIKKHLREHWQWSTMQEQRKMQVFSPSHRAGWFWQRRCLDTETGHSLTLWRIHRQHRMRTQRSGC